MPPGKRDAPAAQNLKPAVKTRPHHGVAQPGQFNQFNTINWYQQTWHTIEFSNNRHTRHHHNPDGRGSLRSNFSNLPESRTLCKSAFPRPTNHPTRPHPNPERTKRRPDPVLKFRGLAASGSQLSAGLPLGDLENNTPTHAPPQLHPPHPPHHPKTPTKPRQNPANTSHNHPTNTPTTHPGTQPRTVHCITTRQPQPAPPASSSDPTLPPGRP